MSERLTWNEIKKRYPHRNVGLVDVEHDVNEVSVKSAIVKYTDNDTAYENLVDMAMNGSITLLYTTLDEDELLEVV